MGHNANLRKRTAILRLRPGRRASAVALAVGLGASPQSAQLPERVRAFVTLLPATPRRPYEEAVAAALGTPHRPNLDRSA
jgi:hypothetical protein